MSRSTLKRLTYVIRRIHAAARNPVVFDAGVSGRQYGESMKLSLSLLVGELC